jgi:hypothetical protein
MISCLFLGGIFYIAGYDINNDPYIVNIDMISHVIEDTTIPDTHSDFYSYRTMITTTNGTVVVNYAIMDVAIGIQDCERYYAIE